MNSAVKRADLSKRAHGSHGPDGASRYKKFGLSPKMILGSLCLLMESWYM